MDRLTIMNLLLIAVVSWAWSVLTHVFIAAFLTQAMSIFLAYLAIYFFVGVFVGYTVFRIGNEKFAISTISIIFLLIALSNLFLKAQLDASLVLLSGDNVHLKSLFGALVAMAFGFILPMAVLIPRESQKRSERSELFPGPDIKLTDVILQEPGLRCPVCENIPDPDGHYIIRCWYCKTEFCSKHLEQFEERCPRCYKPVPFLKELKQALKENKAV